MLRLDDLAQALGGQIGSGTNPFLETEVGGLRTFVVMRTTHAGSAFDLSVFLPPQNQQHPNFDSDWVLEDDERAIPRLQNNFVFTGCRRGMLIASSIREPTLEDVIATLWLLAAWARKPWRPRGVREHHKPRRSEVVKRAVNRWIDRYGWLLLLMYCLFLLSWCASYQTT